MTEPPTRRPGSRRAADTSLPDEGDEDDSPITRAAILASALAIIDRDGVDGLSMRRLGEAVGRDPMVLYRHVPGKAAVLDGVVEIIFDELPVNATNPDWPAELRTIAHEFRELARNHPYLVPLLVIRPLATPLGLRPHGILRPLEGILALLTTAGFSGVQALHMYRALFGFLFGHIVTELQEVVEKPEETDDVLRLGLHRLPVDDFPHLRDLAPILVSYDGLAELDRGLDILLSGLGTELGAPATELRPSATLPTEVI
jgi:AcrR family transcriptional regulator